LRTDSIERSSDNERPRNIPKTLLSEARER
jgi:hypothetical protein